MTDVWTYLKKTNKPIVMYGTGNGADKILDVFKTLNISVSDIFVSDAFFRSQDFRGYTVKSYSDIKKQYDDCVIVLAFAIFREDMLHFVKDISKDYEVLIPEVPVFGTDYFCSDTLEKYKNEIEQVRSVLADEKSVDTFEKLLKYRVTGKPEYLFDCESDREEVFKNILILGEHETYVDLGAYRGDTIEEFLQLTNSKYDKIYALEPDEKNYKKLCEFVENNNLESVSAYNLASWSKPIVTGFSGGGGRNSCLGEGKNVVHTTDVDSLLRGAPVTYIKMDVEGAELETIEGLRETLINYKPKLAISAYHKTGDLFTLPLQILSICPDYKVYLRHHPYLPDWETNYYITVQK